ncbi:MAG: methyltransferase domain-containing protein [bacterium]
MSAPTCRFCNTPLAHTLCDLGMSPLCESILAADQINQMEPFYPLKVWVCHQCLLVQLEQYVSAEHIFTEYAYFSAFSTSWLQHAKDYVAMITERLGLGPGSQVVELASNDGYLLQYFVERGIPALGIEPAANVAEAARKRGVPTLVKFFGRELGAELAQTGKRADLVLGNNVLAQVPDLNSFVGGIAELLKPTGTATLEFPHLQRLIEGNQFDTIYHEHFGYFSLLAVETIFAAHGLTIFDVEELWTHGGSIRIYARPGGPTADASRPIGPRVLEMRAREEGLGFRDMATYAAFEDRVRETKRRILELLIDAKRAGKRIAGYGAPGKGNTLLNYCGIRTDFIEFTVDRNPYKHGRFLPGTHIPCYAPDKIDAEKPDYIFILPWNFKDEILKQLAHAREWGAKFIVPIPEPQIL